jgi:hypothetical protein
MFLNLRRVLLRTGFSHGTAGTADEAIHGLLS